MHLGARLDDDRQQIPANPLALIIKLVDGTLRWPSSATTVLIAIAALLLTVAVAAGLIAGRRRRRGSRVDRAAGRMGRGRDIAPLARKKAVATAKRLGVDSPGLEIARTVAGGTRALPGLGGRLRRHLGAARGKTTSRAIPAILEAPGAVLATSNKRDLVDATRDPRSEVGEVWVFDPQGIVDEPPTWWWNPLTYVTDEVKAEILADVFASASRDPGARTDAYFEPAGQQLLAQPAARRRARRAPDHAGLPVAADPTDDEPVGVLQRHGYPLLAAALQAVVNAPEKQRGGVYGTAQQIASFMTNRQAMQWVTPDGASAPAPATATARQRNPWLTGNAPAGRRELDPHEFVQTSATLYSLSKEGRGSAGPLVTALTVAISEAAEDLAKARPAAGCRSRWSRSSTRPRTSAAGASCPTSTATTARAGSCS